MSDVKLTNGSKLMAEQVRVPDIGEATDVEVIEILVKKGDRVSPDDSLVVLESDKASMEIPSPMAGTVESVQVKVGDKVDEGDIILVMSTEPVEGTQHEENLEEEPSGPAIQESRDDFDSVTGEKPVPQVQSTEEPEIDHSGRAKVHAGPAVRKQAREYGVDLSVLKGSGRFGRMVKEDVIAYVKDRLSQQLSGTNGAGIPAIPEIDFSKFGDIEVIARSRVRQATARNLHRSWLNIPLVTQFDSADITALERFRKDQNIRLAGQGIKMTPLVFFIKAVVSGLQTYPQFNASLHADGANIILKKYINIGIAVETEDGLVVPVVRDADKKGLVALAGETAELARQARERSLKLDALQGATFTISSLGGIGGTAFTPIVNAPEVAILGVSRARTEAVYDGEEFKPRTILPLSLSYDHRAIDGAEAARFTSYLAQVLSDTRLMLL
jgi:pyruvate dehydrogenase E2 component (dihydrolipoamide acetyltransferase)